MGKASKSARGPTWKLSRPESGRNLTRKTDFQPGSTIAQHKAAWSLESSITEHRHERVLEVVDGADLCCNRRCETNLVDAEGLRGTSLAEKRPKVDPSESGRAKGWVG